MNPAKKLWIFISAFGGGFAVVSWIYETAAEGLFWKGVFALILGAIIYRAVIKKV